MAIGEPALENRPRDEPADTPRRLQAIEREALFGDAARRGQGGSVAPLRGADGSFLRRTLSFQCRQLRSRLHGLIHERVERLLLVIDRRDEFVTHIVVGSARDSGGLVDCALAVS